MSVTYDIANTLRANTKHHEPIILEHHPNDSRIKIDDSGICQTLSSRMGTGGGECATNYVFYKDVVGSLCATDYKWVQQEQVDQGKLIIMKCN